MAEAGSLRWWLYDGAGNRFALVEEEDLCGRAGSDCVRELILGTAIDGLLVCGAPRRGGEVRMVIWNRDGSRPEACGNGLRCLALFAHRRGLVSTRRFVVETDAGPRTVEVLPDERVRVSMGIPRVLQCDLELHVLGETRKGTHVDLGNPHFVLEVASVDEAPVDAVGAAAGRDARFSDGVNVGFAQRVSGGLRLRVFERGVGETAACGTGAAAAFVALVGSGQGDIELPGGVLGIDWDGANELFLTGPARELTGPPA